MIMPSHNHCCVPMCTTVHQVSISHGAFSCPYWESEILFAKVVAANQGVLCYTKVWSFVAPDSDDPPFTQVRLSRKFMETQLRAIYPSVCAHCHTAVVMARHYQDALTTEGQLLSDLTFPQSFFSEHSTFMRVSHTVACFTYSRIYGYHFPCPSTHPDTY